MNQRNARRMPVAMAPLLLFFLAAGCLAGCVEIGRMAPGLDPNALPLAVEENAVANCTLLGALVQDVDPGCISLTAERVRCELNVRDRARQMGATHIVWLYRLPTGVAAKAYRCSNALPSTGRKSP